MSRKNLNKMEVAERISQAIATQKRTARDVAASIGVSEVTMSKYVNGVTTPKNAYLVELARELNVSVSWLISGREDQTEVQMWRQRALEAESKLSMLKSAMEGWLSKL